MNKIILWIAGIVSASVFLIFFPSAHLGSATSNLNPAKLVLSPVEQLGKSIYFDRIAANNTIACADCHSPSAGFAGPLAELNIHGTQSMNSGSRKPPSAAYAAESPVLYFDEEKEAFVGGNYWDGRATGALLGNPAADQALGPLADGYTTESAKAALMKISSSDYAGMWEKIWKEPLRYSTEEEISKNIGRFGIALSAYESSHEVNQFTSKFDYSLKGEVKLTDQEELGFRLFCGKAFCVDCHSINHEDLKKSVFTNFSYDNPGIPKNPENPVYKSNPGFVDQGLGGFLATLPVTNPWKAMAAENMGKHKIPTLRNVDKRPGTDFAKVYTHNGYFKSLKELVHFINTRDAGGWPEPEVRSNMNTEEIGNLRLTDAEENAIVAFLKTLSDGYTAR